MKKYLLFFLFLCVSFATKTMDKKKRNDGGSSDSNGDVFYSCGELFYESGSDNDLPLIDKLLKVSPRLIIKPVSAKTKSVLVKTQNNRK